jgi:hypothetical protein
MTGRDPDLHEKRARLVTFAGGAAIVDCRTCEQAVAFCRKRYGLVNGGIVVYLPDDDQVHACEAHGVARFDYDGGD